MLELNSVFNVTCTGNKSVVWDEPLPVNTHVLPGFYTSTLLIDSAAGYHTGEYVCVYKTLDEYQSNIDTMASIYIFVPGK